MINASVPSRASGPVASIGARWDGSRVAGKSGTSSPVQRPASASHQMYFLRSDHGVPSGAAEARLYKIRRLEGHAQPHSSATSFWEEPDTLRSEEHTSELQSRFDLVCRLLLEKKKEPIIHT